MKGRAVVETEAQKSETARYSRVLCIRRRRGSYQSATRQSNDREKQAFAGVIQLSLLDAMKWCGRLKSGGKLNRKDVLAPHYIRANTTGPK